MIAQALDRREEATMMGRLESKVADDRSNHAPCR
jgi:hypothetical protein